MVAPAAAEADLLRSGWVRFGHDPMRGDLLLRLLPWM
jgi:hypothetical protein